MSEEVASFLFGALASSSASRYLREVERFEEESGVDWRAFEEEEELDVAVAVFGVGLFRQNSSRGGASRLAKLVSSLVKLRPGWSLPRSAKVIRAWEKRVPPSVATPVTENQIIAVVSFLRAQGLCRIPYLLVLCFEGYLRCDEGCGALARHFVFSAGGESVVLAIFDPKTDTWGRQAVRISSPAGVEAARRLVELALADGRIIGETHETVLFFLRWGLEAVGVPHVEDFNIHSLRHGGVCNAYLQGASVRDMVLVGRWRTLEALLHYLQSGGLVLYQLSSQGPGVHERVASAGGSLLRSLQ
eukprot:TRINITY_DN2467_c0_g1_i1.p2 TRINITY_DN2467_c0_g1~~TRINITY_DN2467_c0_g1_i1.p2  ORF type:complete len:302 (-),score=13.86 TRINITY_DN2467_c0_g1_i1:244-1149(-)